MSGQAPLDRPIAEHAAPASTSSWGAWVDHMCHEVDAAGQWRHPREFDALGPSGILGNEAECQVRVVSFASNDYLGLASHPEVIGAAHRAIDRWGTGSGASRLVTGSRPVHRALELALAEWKECELAVVFPSGFAANLSVMTVFGDKSTHIFSDELNHASIIDGCRMARAEVTIYPHCDLGALDQALGRARGRPLVVSDTVFSMDGDAADLDSLVEVAGRHGALLVLDEAHAVLGPELHASSARRGPRQPNVLRVGTLSKTLGSLGGFLAGPTRFVELLVNRARPYIFSTALTPADAAAAHAAVGIVQSDEGALLRARLSHHVNRLAKVLGGDDQQASPIVPVIVGDEADAVSASDALLARGVWVPAIRPPTVPAGTSRLRIALSALHRDDQIDLLIDCLVDVGLVTDLAV